MGREIKKVQLDFNWPMNMVWRGFLNPYHSQKCEACGGSGLNEATKQLSDNWYRYMGGENHWSDKLTQDEVNALIKEGRLHDLTHIWSKDGGWQPKEPMPNVTAEMVNAWSREGMGHDAINMWICRDVRAKRLGIYGLCECCSGEGELWFSDKIKELNENFESYEPPEGDGYQIWETVSEGSPISPVFNDKESMIKWLIGEGYSEQAAINFADSGWVMSGLMTNGKIYKNIEACELKEN